MKNLITGPLVAVIAVGGVLGALAGPPVGPVETEAVVEVTVWQRVSDGALYLSTRPAGGGWTTHRAALDMSGLSRSGNFRQGSAVTVEVPVRVDLPGETYEGIGAGFLPWDAALEVVSPYPDSPAEEAGIRPGDIVLAVDGESTEGWTIEEAIERIRGPSGTQVVLTVRHTDLGPGPEVEDITIVRAQVTMPASPPRTIETEAVVEVTVWQRIADGALYLSTRPEGGGWTTHRAALDMSALSRSGTFRQGNAVTVEVPVTLPGDDHGDTFAEATPVAGGATGGVLEWEDDCDVFVLEVEEGTVYLIEVIGESMGDPYFELYDEDEEWLDGDDDSGADSYSALLFWEATYSGQLYIEVGGYETGRYTLRITAEDHGDSFTSATPVETAATAGVLYEDDVDFFVLEVEEGLFYLIEVIDESMGDPYFDLFDEDEEWLDGDDDSGADSYSARLFWEATYSGRLYIEVGGYDAGRYTLRITEARPVER